MPKMYAKGLDETIKRIAKLQKNTVPIFKEAVYQGAGVVADEVRAGLERNINSPRSVSLHGDKFDEKTTESTGDLEKSFGIGKIQQDASGNVNTVVGFHGYDRKGVPNLLKARAMESGTSKLRKRPFVRPAINKCRKRVYKIMGDVLRKKLQEKQKG